MLVREKMTTDLIVADADEPLYDAAKRMSQHRINGVPVVNNNGKIVGVLELHDVLPQLEFVPFSDVEDLRLFKTWVDEHNIDGFADQYAAAKVKTFMRKEVPTLPPDATVADALHTLVRENLRHLFIVDSNKQPVGVMTRSDFLRIMMGKT